MASAVHVGAALTATTHTASGGRLAYVLMTAAEWEREREKRAAPNLPPAPKRPPPWSGFLLRINVRWFQPIFNAARVALSM